MVVRDLRIYAQPLDGLVFHYRDETDLEIDAIVQIGDGRWGAFEIKLGSGPGIVEDAAQNLLAFAAKIDEDRSGTPTVLSVITGTGYGFRREDGVWVLPIGALGP